MFAKLLTDYYDTVKKQLLNEHKDMHKRSRRNRLILQVRGLEGGDGIKRIK